MAPQRVLRIKKIQDTGFKIHDPRCTIHDTRYKIRNPKKLNHREYNDKIHDARFRIQVTNGLNGPTGLRETLLIATKDTKEKQDTRCMIQDSQKIVIGNKLKNG